MDKARGVKRVERGLEGNGKREDDDGGDHGLEALGDAAHGLAEADDAAGDEVDDREHQRDDAAPGKTDKRVGVAEGTDEVAGVVRAAGCIGAEEAAHIEHTDRAGDDEHDNGKDKVDDTAVGVGVFLGAAGAAGEVAGIAGALFKAAHRAVIELEQRERDDEDECQKGIEVIGNGADEELDAGDTGVEVLGRGGHGGRPGRDRRDHAHGSGGGVDEVGELGARDLVAVGDRTHDRADGQAVEVVVDEDEDAENKGGKLRAHAGVDVLFRPAAECRAAAGEVDERHDDAEQHEEEENARVIRNGGDDAVVDDHVDRCNGGEVAGEQRADHNADEERRVRLLGDQRQRNGDDGGHERPEGSDELHDVSPFLCHKHRAKKLSHDFYHDLTQNIKNR